jgi:hypothetical protein
VVAGGVILESLGVYHWLVEAVHDAYPLHEYAQTGYCVSV